MRTLSVEYASEMRTLSVEPSFSGSTVKVP